ncbi:hypothetical protein [Duncaniella muris]|uniref:hypothetical protein n=1 Tax=Duncaniella muris TaxID=2094150 RepID=UPI003F66884D
MKKLYVYADFDWLDNPQLIGELSCDSVRGSETYGFSYDKEWLAKYGDVFLDAVRRTSCRSTDCKSSGTKARRCAVFTF